MLHRSSVIFSPVVPKPSNIVAAHTLLLCNIAVNCPGHSNLHARFFVLLLAFTRPRSLSLVPWNAEFTLPIFWFLHVINIGLYVSSMVGGFVTDGLGGNSSFKQWQISIRFSLFNYLLPKLVDGFILLLTSASIPFRHYLWITKLNHHTSINFAFKCVPSPPLRHRFRSYCHHSCLNHFDWTTAPSFFVHITNLC